MKIHLFLAIVLLFLCTGIKAQRITNSPVTTGCFRQPVVPISLIPTLHSDMNWECMVGYIYFDSLCRSNFNRFQLDSFFSYIRSWDTLKVFMRLKYRMVEYNSDLYEEYNFGSDNYTPYVSAPAVINRFLSKRIDSILGPKNKLTYITEAATILHIRVTEVHSDSDILGDKPINPIPLKCVTATIIDSLKGVHIRSCSLDGGTQPQSEPTSPCISIHFLPYAEKEKTSDVFSVGSDSLGNLTIPCDNCYGTSALQVDHEYIVFLRNVFLDYDGNYSYYTFEPFSGFSPEGGIFSISNTGNVSVPSNYFGYGTIVPLATFKMLLNNDISSITTH